MLLLVDQVKKRTQFLHTYLGQLQTSLHRKKYHQALNFISNQRSNINHTNVSRYNPNTFLIDSLKTKNQKLSQTLHELQKEKIRLQKQIDSAKKKSGGIDNSVETIRVNSFVSKIQFTLKDIRKLQLEPMNLQTNYETLTITTFEQKIYNISLNKIFFIDRKANLLNINCHIESPKSSLVEESLYIAFKFQDETTANVWFNIFTFGKVVSEAKGSRYLFLAKNSPEDLQPLAISKNTNHKRQKSQESEVFAFGNNPLSSGGFKNNLMAEFVQNKAPMYTSVINQKTSAIPENPFYQPQKHLTHSLINEPIKKQLNYANHRPYPLNRVRGKSMYMDFSTKKNNPQFKQQNDEDYMNDQSNFFESKSQHKSSKANFRKASQDITLRPKNPSHQEKKLEKFRSQRNLVDEIISQSNQKTSKQSNSLLHNNSKRIEYQIEKKNEILERNNRSLERSITNTFRPEDNIRWIKQTEEGLSISSKHSKNPNPRFKQEMEYTLEDPDKVYDTNSLQIEEASQTNEISPTFPKKIVYEDGSNIRLYPVQNSQTRPKANSKTTSYYESEQNEDIEPLRETQENEHLENRRIRNERLNTLDSQTQKDRHEIHESNSQENEQEEFQQLLDELKKGLVLTKCAQGSFWTREKEIKLSENEVMLLIIDVKDKKIKKLGISEIVSVQYGKYGKGIIKHIQQIEEKKCFLLSVQQGKQTKKIQFVGNNPQKLVAFATNLNYYVQVFKST